MKRDEEGRERIELSEGDFIPQGDERKSGIGSKNFPISKVVSIFGERV